MPQRISVADLRNHVGEDVLLEGWLYHKRSSGKLHFLEARDGSGIAQCVVFKGDVSPELFTQADHLAQEASLRSTGSVRERGRRKGECGVGAKALEGVAGPRGESPISPKGPGVDALRDHRPLWLRTKRQHAILRVRAEIIAAVRDYF